MGNNRVLASGPEGGGRNDASIFVNVTSRRGGEEGRGGGVWACIWCRDETGGRTRASLGTLSLRSKGGL